MVSPARLAVAFWVAALAAVAAGVVLALVNGFPVSFDPWGVMASEAVTIGSLGALVASYRPGNVIGWMMVAMELLDGLASFGLQYGYFGLVDRPEPLWGAGILATLPYGIAIGAVFSLSITFLCCCSPTAPSLRAAGSRFRSWPAWELSP